MTAADTLTKTMTPRSAVLVQGTPASGTSILSCVMSLIAQEQFEDPKEYTDDPFPHLGQSSAVAGLNRRILQELGSGWGRPGLFYAQGKGVAESAPLIRAMTRDRYLELALGVLRTGSARGELLILQDPSLCLLHDLWDTALRATGPQDGIGDVVGIGHTLGPRAEFMRQVGIVATEIARLVHVMRQFHVRNFDRHGVGRSAYSQPASAASLHCSCHFRPRR